MTEALGALRSEVLRLTNKIGAAQSLDLLRAYADKIDAGERFPGHLTIAEIQASVCRRYNLRPIDMKSNRRSAQVSRPRQVAMYLARRFTMRSLPEIGRRFGGRAHTTVIHALRAVEARRLTDPDLDADIRALEAELAA